MMPVDLRRRFVGRRQFLVGSVSALALPGLLRGTAGAAVVDADPALAWRLDPDVPVTMFNTCDCDLGIVVEGGLVHAQTAWWPNWRRYQGTSMDDLTQLPDAIRDASFSQPHGDDAYWSGGIWADGSGTWYATVHVEFDYATPYSYPHWTRRVGLATSTDLGANWHYEGDILTTSPSAPPPSPGLSDFGDGDHRLLIDERHGYAYLFYERGWSNPGDGYLYGGYMAVARCRLRDGLMPGSWTKWYQGAWSQPGLEGLDSEAIPGATAFMSAHYNTYLRRYVVIDTSGVWTATSLTSQNWVRQGEFPNRVLWYNTPVDPDTGNRWEIGKSLRLYSSQTDVNDVGSKYMMVTFDPAPVAAPFSAAFNNAGISEDGSQVPADFDGGNSSYSQQALTAAGLGPGAALTGGGIQYVMPDVPAGQLDNVVPTGQIVKVPALPGATRLACLGSAANGDASGQVTITYTDGSTQTGPLAFSDWTLQGGAEAPGTGQVVAAVTPYRNIPGAAAQEIGAYLFSSAPIELQPGKTVAQVSLLAAVSGGQLHVFAIGTDKGPLSS